MNQLEEYKFVEDWRLTGGSIESTCLGDFENYKPKSWTETFIKLAYEACEKSKDLSTKIGSVIVRENVPILYGYNGIPKNVKDLPERFLRPQKYSYTEHSERNAIYFAAKFGISTDNTIIYTQALSCVDCARGIIQSGIKKIVTHLVFEEIQREKANKFTGTDWKDQHKISKEMFEEAGVEIFSFTEKIDKVAYIDGKAYEV